MLESLSKVFSLACCGIVLASAVSCSGIDLTSLAGRDRHVSEAHAGHQSHHRPARRHIPLPGPRPHILSGDDYTPRVATPGIFIAPVTPPDTLAPQHAPVAPTTPPDMPTPEHAPAVPPAPQHAPVPPPTPSDTPAPEHAPVVPPTPPHTPTPQHASVVPPPPPDTPAPQHAPVIPTTPPDTPAPQPTPVMPPTPPDTLTSQPTPEIPTTPQDTLTPQHAPGMPTTPQDTPTPTNRFAKPSTEIIFPPPSNSSQQEEKGSMTQGATEQATPVDANVRCIIDQATNKCAIDDIYHIDMAVTALLAMLILLTGYLILRQSLRSGRAIEIQNFNQQNGEMKPTPNSALNLWTEKLGGYTLQIVGLTFIIPTILMVAVATKLSSDAVTALLGSMIGYIFASARSPETKPQGNSQTDRPRDPAASSIPEAQNQTPTTPPAPQTPADG